MRGVSACQLSARLKERGAFDRNERAKRVKKGRVSKPRDAKTAVSTRPRRGFNATDLSAVREKVPSIFGRSPPSVARVRASRRTAGRGERRDREPRDVPSGCRASSRREPRARVVSMSSAPRGADRRAAPRHRDASLGVGVGRDALSSAREETRRRAVRAKQTRARWMTHLVPRGPVPRAPLHHLQLVLDQSELLRTGRAFARAGRGR